MQPSGANCGKSADELASDGDQRTIEFGTAGMSPAADAQFR
jgi:hypothetical protein